MRNGWRQKIENNLLEGHPLNILWEDNLRLKDEPLKRNNPIFNSEDENGSPEWHNSRIVFCSLETWCLQHPADATFRDDKDGNEFL